MEDLKITERQKELIEKVGVTYEKSGLPPAVSRVLGLLLISDRTELTFDEIRDTLNLSKSATSNAINVLLTHSRIEYITYSGDRKRYFRSKVRDWQDGFNRTLETMEVFQNLFKEILEQRNPETKDFNIKLAEVIDFIEFFKLQVPEIYKKWELRNK
jgi:DNA-binding transcriptional regulator GbsR (MarR family)